MNRHRQKLYDYLTGDTHIKLTKRERAKCRRMQERRANRMRVHFQRVYFSYGIKRSDGRYEFTPQPESYYGTKYANPKHVAYWGIEHDHAQDDNFSLDC